MKRLICACLALFGVCLGAAGSTVNEIARLDGQGRSDLIGLGLVIGLPGTGDSGKDLVVARPLAQVLRNMGNPIPDFAELANSKSAALVMVTCSIGEGGARANDAYDVKVAAVNAPKSLEGGMLLMTPLRGPYPGDPVYAMARGQLVVEDDQTPTVGRVRQGAQLIRDIKMPAIGDSFMLVLRPWASGYTSAAEIAGRINQEWYGTDEIGPAIAAAIDDRTIRIDIPRPERTNRPRFVGDVLATNINDALLKLPEQVICNQQIGIVAITGDVEISPVAITHNDLVITFTVPPPVATPEDPLIERGRWTSVQTGARPSQMAKLQDLIAAFKQLDVPPKDQIAVIDMLHKTGRLHARLIYDD